MGTLSLVGHFFDDPYPESVCRDEAQFMMGVCAASCSCLLGKQRQAVGADVRRAGDHP